MMSRFTENAQEALQRAQQVMFAKQHTQLDVEHIFLALLQQRNSTAAQIVFKLGGDPQVLLKGLEKALNSMQSWPATRKGWFGSRSTTTGYITLRCNRVLQGAAEEADRLNHDFISNEHIFLAITYERGGVSGELLEKASITHDKVLEVLSEDWAKHPEVNQQPSAREEERSKRIINPPVLARPIGFNHGILTTGGRLLFLAGQTALDGDGNVVAVGDVVGQYRQVLTNLWAVLKEAGGEMQDIVKMTIYVKDRDDYLAHLKPLGQVHKEYFDSYYPAMALVEISRFFQEGVLVEVEGIAVLGT